MRELQKLQVFEVAKNDTKSEILFKFGRELVSKMEILVDSESYVEYQKKNVFQKRQMLLHKICGEDL